MDVDSFICLIFPRYCRSWKSSGRKFTSSKHRGIPHKFTWTWSVTSQRPVTRSLTIRYTRRRATRSRRFRKFRSTFRRILADTWSRSWAMFRTTIRVTTCQQRLLTVKFLAFKNTKFITIERKSLQNFNRKERTVDQLLNFELFLK